MVQNNRRNGMKRVRVCKENKYVVLRWSKQVDKTLSKTEVKNRMRQMRRELQHAAATSLFGQKPSRIIH